jgi:HK97 family phage major capsid protein
MPEFTSQAAIKEDEQFLVGSGIKEPQGILNGTLANGAPFNTDVSTQVTGSAAAITFDGFVATPYNIAGQYRMRNKASVGWAFTSTTAGLLAKLKNADGEYLWREMYGNNAVAAPDTLRGYKTFESEAMPEVAANTFPVLFGDFEGYRIVDRVGMSVERYSDSTTAATDSVIFYLRRRYGGQCAEGYRFVAMKCSV